MLLSQFKQIQEIDQKLNKLHNQRSKLFADASPDQAQTQAASIVPTAIPFTAANNAATDEQWAQQTYADLLNKWQARGLKLPTYKKLSRQLNQARQMLIQISIIKPELHGRMSVVLVPPTKELAYSSAAKLTGKRSRLHLSNDYLEANFSKPKASKSWKLVLVYNEAEGIYLGTPQQLLNEKRYVVAGYDTYALGRHEYAAFIQQEAASFDTATWTALLQGIATDSALVPAVKFDGTSYVFDSETAITPFGDIRFRPAIAVE